jgi:hypothetical protein
MTTAASAPAREGARRRPSAARGRPGRLARGDGWLYLALGVLLAAAWQFSQMGVYSAGSDLGYWIGVAGASMMLLLFAYPLRKRSPALARFGKAKHWFTVHMVLGVLGPVMVLAHSAFRIGSLNAGVALISMLIVAASGVIGRFIYLRTHHGLGGEIESFEALRAQHGFADDAARTSLHFAPTAEARLVALQAHAGRPRDAWADHLRSLLVLPWQVRRQRYLVRREALARLLQIAAEQRWDAKTLRARERRLHRIVSDYTASVLRIAQLAAYSRLFSLWHVLHVPFVFLMVVCAVVHVVAVHAY